jgi:hypothetical protein
MQVNTEYVAQVHVLILDRCKSKRFIWVHSVHSTNNLNIPRIRPLDPGLGYSRPLTHRKRNGVQFVADRAELNHSLGDQIGIEKTRSASRKLIPRRVNVLIHGRDVCYVVSVLLGYIVGAYFRDSMRHGTSIEKVVGISNGVIH